LILPNEWHFLINRPDSWRFLRKLLLQNFAVKRPIKELKTEKLLKKFSYSVYSLRGAIIVECCVKAFFSGLQLIF
jgi:hypothetical protein